jgi:hypothetical protein
MLPAERAVLGRLPQQDGVMEVVMSWAIEASAEAPLSPEEIFAFYLEPSTWGSWGHNTKWARARGPVVVGATVDVKAGYGTVYPVLVRSLEPDRFIECEVHPPGMVVVNRYAVEPSERGARLRHSIEVSGRLARITKALQFDKLYTSLLRKEIRRLIALAQAGPPRAQQDPA